MTTTAHDAIVETAKAAPPLAGISAWLAGITLNDWLVLATLIYTLLLIGHKLQSIWRDTWRDWEKSCGTCQRRRSTDR